MIVTLKKKRMHNNIMFFSKLKVYKFYGIVKDLDGLNLPVLNSIAIFYNTTFFCPKCNSTFRFMRGAQYDNKRGEMNALKSKINAV